MITVKLSEEEIRAFLAQIGAKSGVHNQEAWASFVSKMKQGVGESAAKPSTSKLWDAVKDYAR